MNHFKRSCALFFQAINHNNHSKKCGAFKGIDKRKFSRKVVDGQSSKELLENAASFEDSEVKDPENYWTTSPYPKSVKIRDQSKHSLRPKIDPRETSIILFPGQGIQFVGMGNNLLKFPTVRDIFEAASEVVKYDVLKLCLNGPAEKLNRTDFQQIAILVCSLSALEALKEERPSVVENCIAAAGFSLGEISALIFAEVLSLEDGLKLTKIRGEAMQLASEMSPGAMATVYYGPDSKLSQACQAAKEHAMNLNVENPYCAVSNYLFPHCKMIAGNLEAIEFIQKNKGDFKLKGVRRLPVSGAFHTPLMEPAVEVFKRALKKMNVCEPSIAVHSNIDGKIYKDRESILRKLPKQIVAPVKWEQTMHIIYERPSHDYFPRTYECGPGKSLSTILKMVNSKAWESCFNVPV